MTVEHCSQYRWTLADGKLVIIIHVHACTFVQHMPVHVYMLSIYMDNDVLEHVMTGGL